MQEDAPKVAAAIVTDVMENFMVVWIVIACVLVVVRNTKYYDLYGRQRRAGCLCVVCVPADSSVMTLSNIVVRGLDM